MTDRDHVTSERWTLVERLRKQAQSVSQVSKALAADKSARNQAAGDIGAEYVGAIPEQTLEWQAADEIEQQRVYLEEFDGEAQRAWQALAYYGAHRVDCRRPTSGRCTCGFELARDVHMFPVPAQGGQACLTEIE